MHKRYTTVLQKKFVNVSRANQKATMIEDMSADFHPYGAGWHPDAIEWYFDDQQITIARTPAELNTPLDILVNLAVCGRWGVDPDSSTHFPAIMETDYIRTYEQRV